MQTDENTAEVECTHFIKRISSVQMSVGHVSLKDQSAIITSGSSSTKFRTSLCGKTRGDTEAVKTCAGSDCPKAKDFSRSDYFRIGKKRGL